MPLRLDVIGQLSALALFSVLGCSDSDPGGTAGTGGKSTSGGTAGSGGGGAAGSSTAGMAGASGGSAGTSGGSSSTGGGTSGASAGGAGGSSAGSGGTSAGAGGSSGSGGAGGAGGKSKTTFFVSSDTSKTGKLGGLDGADKRCQDLAGKAGITGHTFHAYLSTATVNAKDRIGMGPWVNSKGVTLAADLTALHASTLKGDHTLFIDENGKEIDGQWNSAPELDWSLPENAGKLANQHDIFTGSKADGTLQTGQTCKDWTSDAAADTAQVGHSDGMGPGMATTGNYGSWSSVHASGGCATTYKAGGAGRIYCFAID